MQHWKRMLGGGAAMLVCVGAAHAGPVSRANAQAVGLAAADDSYVRSAQRINQAEIALGQLAQQRGSADEVKQMARTMVQRHSALAAQLADLARDRGAATAQGRSSEDEQVHDRLATLSGRSFDEAFQQAVADTHARELALHRAELAHGGDPGLRGYAQSRVKALEASMVPVKHDW